MKKNFQVMIYVFLTAMLIIGGLLGLYLIGKKDEVFNFKLAIIVILSTIGGALVGILSSKLRKKKNARIPEFDERSLLIMKRYFLIVLYIVLIGSGSILVILYGAGVYTIETGALIAYMAVLYILILAGGFVVKRLL